MSARQRAALGAALLLATSVATPASAERLISALSTSRVLIASNFTGADVVLFGSVERDAQTVARRGGYDIVVTVTGPRENIVTFRKQRVAAIWVNADSRT
ncbi:MAG: TIGR02186 family protein, partial [Alphaproteobacteria bacterium]|nr:TIGR02186 family protein [Alphaproteobacteria bacterium]